MGVMWSIAVLGPSLQGLEMCATLVTSSKRFPALLCTWLEGERWAPATQLPITKGPGGLQEGEWGLTKEGQLHCNSVMLLH